MKDFSRVAKLRIILSFSFLYPISFVYFVLTKTQSVPVTIFYGVLFGISIFVLAPALKHFILDN